jgi:hypothetical protein
MEEYVYNYRLVIMKSMRKCGIGIRQRQQANHEEQRAQTFLSEEQS